MEGSKWPHLYSNYNPFLLYFTFLFIAADVKQIEANPDAKRLYDDLLSNYNRLIRPVENHTETVTVWMSLKLSQLIEMNLKNQVMTTNLWILQVTFIYKRKLLNSFP